MMGCQILIFGFKMWTSKNIKLIERERERERERKVWTSYNLSKLRSLWFFKSSIIFQTSLSNSYFSTLCHIMTLSLSLSLSHKTIQTSMINEGCKWLLITFCWSLRNEKDFFKSKFSQLIIKLLKKCRPCLRWTTLQHRQW
jgi:hypothetical protein